MGCRGLQGGGWLGEEVEKRRMMRRCRKSGIRGGGEREEREEGIKGGQLFMGLHLQILKNKSNCSYFLCLSLLFSSFLHFNLVFNAKSTGCHTARHSPCYCISKTLIKFKYIYAQIKPGTNLHACLRDMSGKDDVESF